MQNNQKICQKRPNFRCFEFSKNMIGANYIVVDMNSWTVHDCGFGSRAWIGGGVKLVASGKRLCIKQPNGEWLEISADLLPIVG
nr:hypothetical protein [uncultured Moraxella sp.]